MLIHVVAEGENWFDISERYDLSVDYLKKLNSIAYNNLAVGENILIAYPKTEYYAVQGDTLANIARMHDTTTISLLRNNPSLARGVRIGDRVIIEFEDKKHGSLLLNGYCYTFIDPAFYTSLLPYLTFVTIFTYGFNTNGELIAPRPADDLYVSIANDYGTVPLMHLSTLTENGNFSNELAGEMLGNRGLWDTFINNILSNVRSKGYGGVDMDFEYLPAENSKDYADFAGMLKQALNNEGYYLITALAPKTSAEQPGLLYQGHDYKLLGKNSDLSLIMTYEWGYAYSEPMAVAPIQSVERVVKYGISEIEPNKILLGIPFYGYDWQLPYIRGVTVGKSLSVERAVELARQYYSPIIFDEQSDSPYINYNDGENEHTVWFEDPQSLKAKLELIEKYSLAGGGIWNIDRPFYQGYMLINLLYDIEKLR